MRVLLPAVLFVLAAVGGHAGDRSPAPYYQAPARIPAPLIPEAQTDDFSCGYHALSAIYCSYGLDPRRARLRARLGTSVPAIPFVSDSTGTLQPDLFRVLDQDGFGTEVVRPRNPKERSRLVSHLESGQYALALVETRRAGGLHWIVFTEHRNGTVTAGDSLRSGLQQVDLADLADGPLLSCVLLTPGTPTPGSPYHRAHAAGLGEMIVTTWQSAPLVSLMLLIGCLALLGYLAKRLRRWMRSGAAR